MGKVLVTEEYLADIADAIREQTGSLDTYTPAQMGDAVRAIEGGEGVPVSLLPTMNSNSQDGYIARASSEFSSSYQAYMAFDGGTSHVWAPENIVAEHWVEIEMPSAKRATKFVITTRSGSYFAQRVTVQGSNNGINYTDLGSAENMTEGSTFTVFNESNTEFSIYRFSIDNYGLAEIYIEGIDESGGGGGGASMELKYYTAQTSGSYEIDEDGVYMIICATSYGSTHTVTIPQGATIIDEQEDYDFSYGNGRGIEVKIVELSAGDEVSIEQTYGQWIGRAFAIVKLVGITISQNDSFDAVDDGTKTVTVTAGTKKLVLGVAIGSSIRNDTSISESVIFIGGAWGNGAIVALYVTDSAGTFSFYGYDGGIGSVGVWSLDE